MHYTSLIHKNMYKILTTFHYALFQELLETNYIEIILMFINGHLILQCWWLTKFVVLDKTCCKGDTLCLCCKMTISVWGKSTFKSSQLVTHFYMLLLLVFVGLQYYSENQQSANSRTSIKQKYNCINSTLRWCQYISK